MAREELGHAAEVLPAATSDTGTRRASAPPPIWFPLVFFGAAELAGIPLLHDVDSCGPAGEFGPVGIDCRFYSSAASYSLGPFTDVVNAFTYGLAVIVIGLAATWIWYRRAGARTRLWWPALAALACIGIALLMTVQNASALFGDETYYGALWLPVVAVVLLVLALQARNRWLIAVALADLIATYASTTQDYGFRSTDDAILDVLPFAMLLLVSGLLTLARNAQPTPPPLN
jgi:hypothetical protein